MSYKIFLLTILIIYSNFVLYAQTEKYYQEIFCHSLGGITEYRLWDKTRVDCVTKRYAIEVDFAKKWAEAIGQSLYYAKTLKKEPAIALIIDFKKEKRFIRRLRKAIEGLEIRLYFINKLNRHNMTINYSTIHNQTKD